MQSLFGRVGGAKQAGIIAVGIVVTALVFGVSRWATQPTMVPLFADIPIESVHTMTDKLTEVAIPFELDREGSTILVGSTDVARARVELAREALPSGARPGLELFDKPTWGMTDYTQKVNYRRALEGELERSIGKIVGVKSTQVHLALEDDQIFKQNARPSKASVTLMMNDGLRPNENIVRGIAGLVAGSVGGLDPQHVTILDERGQALAMDDETSLSGLSNRQLALQREVENYLEEKASTLLSSLVGLGNARVQVAASINFDKVERTTQAVDPDKQAMSTEQRAEVTPGTPQQGAGYSTVATTYENTRSVETFSGAIGNLTRMTVAVLVADKVSPGAPSAVVSPDSQGVAVPSIITPRNADEIARIETLVRNALGVDSTRGDMISVVSAPFDIPVAMIATNTIAEPSTLDKLTANAKPIVALASLAVLLLVAVVTLSALKAGKKSKNDGSLLQAAPGYAELPASTSMKNAQQQARDQAQLHAEFNQLQGQSDDRGVILPPLSTTPEREQAIATIDQRPRYSSTGYAKHAAHLIRLRVQ